MEAKSASLLACALLAAAAIVAIVPKVLPWSSGPARERAFDGGQLKYVMTYKYPAEHSSNESMEYLDGRVEVFDRFIVIDHSKGDRTLHLHGWYANLKYVPDR